MHLEQGWVVPCKCSHLPEPCLSLAGVSQGTLGKLLKALTIKFQMQSCTASNKVESPLTLLKKENSVLSWVAHILKKRRAQKRLPSAPLLKLQPWLATLCPQGQDQPVLWLEMLSNIKWGDQLSSWRFGTARIAPAAAIGSTSIGTAINISQGHPGFYFVIEELVGIGIKGGS